MKLGRRWLVVCALGLCPIAPAATWYVAASGSDAAAGTNWLTAKQTIQAAIDLSVSNDLVLVSNGVYATGGRIAVGTTTNRVVIDKPVRVQSVNGPAVTTIAGAGPRGNAAVRCAYVGSNAVLSGFTLTNGATRMTGDHYLEQSGGGAWCEINAVVEHCWITGNTAAYGGGAYLGLLNRCILAGNTATNGGGARSSVLTSCLLHDNLGVAGGGTDVCTVRNCTLVHNTAIIEGGGARGGTIHNSVVYYNTAPAGPNFYGSTVVAYTCTTPPAGGAGDITNAPLLAGLANPHLLAASPCIDAGTNLYSSGEDIDGDPRLFGTRVDMGCDETTLLGFGPLAAQIAHGPTNLVLGYPYTFEALVEGVPETLRWKWGDGTATTNLFLVERAFTSTGRYSVVLEAANSEGMTAATVTVEVVDLVYHVAPGGGHVPPFADWATASTSIQAAIDIAQPGALVLVSNGVFDTGGRVVFGALTNRIAITNDLRVRSVNGPMVTHIVGAWQPGGDSGDAAVRCVYLGSNCSLVGFTLTNGATRNSGDNVRERSGGGLWAEANAAVSNCVLTGNAARYGGGSYGGVLGGCQLIGNNASSFGGGAQTSVLYNCLLAGNRALFGGGTQGASLYGCTVIGNTATGVGGGAFQGYLFNSIVYHNQALNTPNVYSASATYCCTTPDPGGTGNITNQPLVASAANPHLLAGSPCVDAGNHAYSAGRDLDGDPRLVGVEADIGCDEFAPPVTGPLAVRLRVTPTNIVPGLVLFAEGEVDGAPERLRLDWGDGNLVTNQFRAAHQFATSGTFAVVLRTTNATHSAAATVTVVVAEQPVHFVAPGGGHLPPFTNWIDAATNIQAAIDAAAAGALILVSNGTYAGGGRVITGFMTNRVALTNSITVRSVNGPAVTTIEGRWDPSSTNNQQSVRCAYVGTNSLLSGFTLYRGSTRNAGDGIREQSGAGAWVEPSGVVSNCILTGNIASSLGGGSYGGTFVNCRYVGNRAAQGGGACTSRLVGCTVVSNVATLGGGTLLSTLTRCFVASNAAVTGGGAHGGLLEQCTLVSNTATSGGGAYGAQLINCALLDNQALTNGGGALLGTLTGCTLAGNRAATGGGVCSGTLYNCVVYYNEASNGPNYYGGTLDYCCVAPFPTSGVGHVAGPPLLAGPRNPHLLADSPAIDAGLTAWATGNDLDGQPRVADGVVDIGCDEYAGAAAGPLTVAIRAGWTNFAPGYAAGFEALVEGTPDRLIWTWGDGTATTNLCLPEHAYAAPGDYLVVLRATNSTSDVAATVVVQVAHHTYHVAPGGGHVPPFADWTTAATNIQSAIDTAVPGGLVLVSNGVYDTGGRLINGALTNRIAVTNAIAVQSVNGAEATLIVGAWTPSTNGDAAVRCVHLGSNCTLIGFTLTNGATRQAGDPDREQCGGGVWCETNAMVLNCVLAGNAAAQSGGGSWRGQLEECLLLGNTAGAQGGGAFLSRLISCNLEGNRANFGGGCATSTLSFCEVIRNTATRGGGLYQSTADQCSLISNLVTAASTGQGGGAHGGALTDCLLAFNTAAGAGGSWGGGAYASVLARCRLFRNLCSGSPGGAGGGAFSGILSNCALEGNSAYVGGGAQQATLYNCFVTSNSATSGGGANESTLRGCTVVRNMASSSGGGAATSGSLINCIIYHNTAPANPNAVGVSMNYCCTTPLPGAGTGHVTNAPLLASAGNPHLLRGSPCVNVGDSALASGVDWDGEARVINGTVDIGCDEQPYYHLGDLAIQAWAVVTNVAVGFPIPFELAVEGVPATLLWIWGDGTETTNQFQAAHAFAATGLYTVVAQAANDSVLAAATVTVQVVDTVYHVAPGGGHIPPFADWASAATQIQAAVDAAIPGALVLVSNGVYDTGGAVAVGALTNRVSVTKPLTVASVHGPAVTSIVGAPDPATTNGDAAVRCVYLCSNAVLSGFTLTNGATRTSGDARDQRGGGVWCATNAVVSNCVLTGNFANEGGGAGFGMLRHCALRGNQAGSGGGAYGSTLHDCTVSDNAVTSFGGGLAFGLLNRGLVSGNTAAAGGGGMYYSTVSNAVLRGNATATHGGGAYWGQLYNCVVSGNFAAQAGGGTFNSSAIHCTLAGNVAAGDGGGTYNGAFTNCIIYFNTGTCGSNVCGSALAYCCTTPDPGGPGNITNEPLFAATNDFHLAAGSPCIDAGHTPAAAGTLDLDGLPRVRFGGVDIGAYEFQTPLGYWQWAEAITNGLTGYTESAAGDAYPNLLRYAAGVDADGAADGADLSVVLRSNQLVAVQFRRNTNAVDITLLVEAAAAHELPAPAWIGLATNRFGSWGGAGHVAEQLTNPAAATVQVWLPDGPGTSRVLRLRVTRP